MVSLLREDSFKKGWTLAVSYFTSTLEHSCRIQEALSDCKALILWVLFLLTTQTWCQPLPIGCSLGEIYIGSLTQLEKEIYACHSHS
jgi:hypothetical protein